MPFAAALIGPSFRKGLKLEALGTYDLMTSEQREVLGRIANLDIPSDARTEYYYYDESAPHIVRWPRNEAMSEKGFKGIQFSVTNQRFARGIPWFEEDAADRQAGNQVDSARRLGRSAALLDERVIFQMMTSGTDNDLLASIPNGPDGAAIFAETAASAARFGAANGNIMDGSISGGVATSAAIRTDYLTARAQFALFQDTEGEPLFDANQIDSPATLVHSPSNLEVMIAAFNQELVAESSAGVTNVIRAGNLVPRLWKSQRATANDYWIFLEGPDVKVFGVQTREPLQEVMSNWQNSDQSKRFGTDDIRFKMRKGYFAFLPYAGIHVDN